MTGLPQELGQFGTTNVWQVHQHSVQNVKLEITKKVYKVRLKNVLFPKNLEQTQLQKCAGKNFVRVLFTSRV